MALNEIQQLKKLVEASKYILLTFNSKGGSDAICSALGWKSFLEKQHKHVDIISENFIAPKNLRFLDGLKDIKSEVDHLQKFVIKVDVSNVDIDTISYDIKDNWLSVNLTPKQGIITKNELRTAQSNFKYDLIITINSHDLESLGPIFLNNTDLFYRVPVVNFDNSASNENYGQINFVDFNTTSTSENVFKVLTQINPALIDKELATTLLAGIIGRTQSFKANNITPSTLNTASHLMKLGADREKIVRHFYYDRSIASLKMWGQALTHLKSDRQLGLVWTSLTRDDFIRSGASQEDLSDLIDELIANSPEAKVIVLLSEIPEAGGANKIHGLVVSNNAYDAYILARPFSPQGSKKRVSFIIEGKTLPAAETEVIENIKKALT